VLSPPDIPVCPGFKLFVFEQQPLKVPAAIEVELLLYSPIPPLPSFEASLPAPFSFQPKPMRDLVINDGLAFP
jgi:hypothetical protein